MRIGEPRPYTIDGVTFFIREQFGPRRDHAETCTQQHARDRDEPGVADDVDAKIEDSAFAMLDALVVRIEGLEEDDDEGKPILFWSPRMRRELSQPMLTELLNRTVIYDSDDRRPEDEGEEDPLATPATPSPTPSSTTTEDD